MFKKRVSILIVHIASIKWYMLFDSYFRTWLYITLRYSVDAGWIQAAVIYETFSGL